MAAMSDPRDPLDTMLAACGLPAGWAQQAQWRILQTGFGAGLHFLHAWQAWRIDDARPQLLHFVATTATPPSAADLLRAAQPVAHLQVLAQELAAQCWGLLPGVHRLRFEGGRVLLTLLVGDTQSLLRQQDMVVDSIWLGDDSAAADLHTLKAIARCARRGTRLAAKARSAQLRKDLAQCGFQLAAAPEHEYLESIFDPAWQPRKAPLWPRGEHAIAANALPGQRRAVVIGAGIAGAACAQQLALRGWQVTVLDSAAHPAAGASALPAGIFAPHTSSDDSLLSRITRAGLRTTVQWAQQLLQAGQDWELTGVLERRQLATPRDETAAHTEDMLQSAGDPKRHGAHERPAAWNADLADAAAPWSQPASAEVLAAQGLPTDDAALWHPHGGWLRPAALVQALLQQPGIRFMGNTAVAQIAPVAGAAAWSVQDAQDNELAQADLVVVCAGPQSSAVVQAVLPSSLPLQPIRGQVSWGRYAPGDAVLHHPVNGHGSWVPFYRGSANGEAAWVMGSSFERDVTDLPPAPADAARAHADNWKKLQTLLPAASQRYAASFATAQVWAQLRCASNDRLPLVGPLLPQGHAALEGGRLSPQICTAMGSRGLTWALLCAELLAARLHGEPLPVGNALAKALAVDRCF